MPRSQKLAAATDNAPPGELKLPGGSVPSSIVRNNKQTGFRPMRLLRRLLLQVDKLDEPGLEGKLTRL